MTDASEVSGNRTAALAAALFSITVWGASFAATKLAVAAAPPTVIVWLRFTMGAVILAAAVAVRREFTLPPTPDLWRFAGLGFIGITLHQFLQSHGLVTSEATTTAWIVASAPIFMAVIGWFFLREKTGVLAIGGLAVATAGVLLVVTKGDLASLMEGNFGARGNLLILASAPNWAVFSVLSRGILRRYTPTLAMFYVMGFGWLLITLQFFAEGHDMASAAGLTGKGWAATVFLGVACSGLAYIFWYGAMRDLPAAHAGALLYLEPLVTVAVAAALLGESITPGVVAGGALIFAGVWIVNRK